MLMMPAILTQDVRRVKTLAGERRIFHRRVIAILCGIDSSKIN